MQNFEVYKSYFRASMAKLDFTHKPTQWLVLALLALTWGSSFILMKKGLIYFSSTEVASFRIGLAALVLAPISLRNLPKMRGNFWPLLVTGMFGNAIPAFLFALAQTQIPSGLSGVLNSLTSLFTLLIGVFLFKSKTTWAQVSGVFIALIGAASLIGIDHLAHFSTHGKYSLLVVAASGMYGIAVNTIKAKLPHMRPTHITALSFLLTGPICLVYLFFGTSFIGTISGKPESWLALIYLCILAIVGTAAAVVLFNRLIKETTAVFASSVTYLIPIVAVGWGALDGESIGGKDVLYMLLILTGIFLINMKSPLGFLRALLARK